MDVAVMVVIVLASSFLVYLYAIENGIIVGAKMSDPIKETLGSITSLALVRILLIKFDKNREDE